MARVRDHHNELAVSVAETTAPNRRFTLRFRVFDDGLGFRYEFPAQPGLGEFAITGRADRVRPGGQREAWWIPSNRPRMDRSEELYSSSAR